MLARLFRAAAERRRVDALRLFSRRRQVVSHHEPVLGTVLTLRLTTRSRERADQAERDLLDEIDRLARIFSVFDPDSELNRWRLADARAPGDELARLLALALDWQAAGGGVFNPAVGFLTERWKVAEREDVLPSADEVAMLAADIQSPRYSNTGGRIEKIGDCSGLNFNAIAKGLVVDLATARVFEAGGLDVMVVNIGGDLVHRGEGELVVGIEDPRRAYDNAEPLAKVAIAGQGLATSGSARRGFRIGGTWYSHVIDPRTGWPVDRVASASVIARDAATADVVATLLSVLAPDEGCALVDAGFPGFGSMGAGSTRVGDARAGDAIGCCIVGDDGALTTNALWDAQAR